MVLPGRLKPDYQALDQPAVQAALESLSGWELAADGTSIGRNFRFRTFVDAFSFMTEVALTAERMNHHPEWFNVYGRVDVRLTTHATGGITDFDIHLAVVMNRAAEKRGI